jgi:hypothetical protein
LASWARFGLLHHPDPVLCSTISGGCQGGKDDNHQKSLRAAWIGVMQKDWIPQEMPRRCGMPSGGWWRSRSGARSSSSSGCGVLRRLESVVEVGGPLPVVEVVTYPPFTGYRWLATGSTHADFAEPAG